MPYQTPREILPNRDGAAHQAVHLQREGAGRPAANGLVTRQ